MVPAISRPLNLVQRLPGETLLGLVSLSLYVQIREALLELLDTRIRDLCAGQTQKLQPGQPLEMLDARIRDLGAEQIQVVQPGQAFEVGQTRIGDLGVR